MDSVLQGVGRPEGRASAGIREGSLETLMLSICWSGVTWTEPSGCAPSHPGAPSSLTALFRPQET